MGEQLGVVVVAAGKGTRMGTSVSKPYLTLGDKPVVVHTLELFQSMPEVDSIALVVGLEHISRCEEYRNTFRLDKVHAVVPGDAERQHSVYRGLLELRTEWVMVHDGVRPFVLADQVRRCWNEAKKHGAAVLAVPVKDTIKVVDPSGTICSTPDRRSLWAIQTPQAFRLAELIEAHRKARADGYVGTDDAALMERMGVPVVVAEGSYGNIKITTPDDLPWAEFWLSRRNGERGKP